MQRFIILQITLFYLTSQVCFCDNDDHSTASTSSSSSSSQSQSQSHQSEIKIQAENKLIRDNLKVMKKIMNPNINPCENFIDYACGNYNMKDMYDVGIFPNVANNQYVELAFATDNESLLFESALKAKQFYMSCLKRGNLKEILEKVNVLQSIKKTWPIVNEDSISGDGGVDRKAWMKISEELKLLDLDPILEIAYDDFDMIEVFSGREINAPAYNKKDIDELNNTLIEFGTNQDDALKVIEDIINFTRDRQQIFELSNECGNVSSCEEDKWSVLNLYYEMKSFKAEFSGIDWNEYFKIVLGREFINDAEPIKIRRQKTTKPYLELIARTNPKTITNYVVWTLIKGLQKLGTVDEENCGAKTFGQFQSVLTAIYSKLLFNTNDRERYLRVLDRFENAFDYAKQRYMVPHQRNLLYILVKERRYINILDSVFSIEKLNEDYKNVTIDTQNYYQNLINLGQQRKCNLIERECMDRLDLMIFIFEVASMHNKPTYFSFSNKYYYLWESVIQHCFTRRRLNSTKFQEIKNCALHQAEILNFNDADSDKSVIVTAALKQTFEDYERWLLMMQQNDNAIAENELKIFKEFNLNRKQAFFLNFVQGHCNQEEKIKNTIQQGMMNLEEFSNVYECRVGSPMSLENKCVIW